MKRTLAGRAAIPSRGVLSRLPMSVDDSRMVTFATRSRPTIDPHDPLLLRRTRGSRRNLGDTNPLWRLGHSRLLLVYLLGVVRHLDLFNRVSLPSTPRVPNQHPQTTVEEPIRGASSIETDLDSPRSLEPLDLTPTRTRPPIRGRLPSSTVDSLQRMGDPPKRHPGWTHSSETPSR